MSIRMMTLVWERSQHKASDLLGMMALADHARDNGRGIRIRRRLLAAKCRMRSVRSADAIIDRLIASGELILVHKGGARPGDTNRYEINVKQLMAQPYMLDTNEDDYEAEAMGAEVAPIGAGGMGAGKGARMGAGMGAGATAPEPGIEPIPETGAGAVGVPSAPLRGLGWLEGAFNRMESQADKSPTEIEIAGDRKISDESYRDACLAFHRAYPEARYDRALWVGHKGLNIERFIQAWKGDDALLAEAVALARKAGERDALFAPRAPVGMITYLDAARARRDAPKPLAGANGHAPGAATRKLTDDEREGFLQMKGPAVYLTIWPGQYIADVNLPRLAQVKYPGAWFQACKAWRDAGNKAVDIDGLMGVYETSIKEFAK